MRRVIKPAVPLKLRKLISVTFQTLTSLLPLRSITEGVYSITLSVLRLRSDKSLECSTITSHHPATLSKPHNPTVFVIVFICDIQICYIFYSFRAKMSILFRKFSFERITFYHFQQNLITLNIFILYFPQLILLQSSLSSQVCFEFSHASSIVLIVTKIL